MTTRAKESFSAFSTPPWKSGGISKTSINKKFLLSFILALQSIGIHTPNQAGQYIVMFFSVTSGTLV